MDAAPAPVDAYQRSLGSTNISYGGVLETEPEDGRLDSAGRPLLPKGAICPIDVEEIALPLPGATSTPLIDVCPEARDFFEKMSARMLLSGDQVDHAAVKAQRTTWTPSSAPRLPTYD